MDYMMNYMIKGLFKYFGETSADPYNVTVLGVDFGSTMRVVWVYKDRISGKVSYQSLYLNRMGDYQECAESYYGKYYTNYKVLPSRADEVYCDEGSMQIDLSNPSYGELMGRAFAKLMERVLENNESVAERARDIYLFVNRPAGDCWAKEDREYRRILMANLSEVSAAYSKRFHMVIISEALAVMSGILNDRPYLDSQTVAVIDGGRSSFDCTVVRGGKILCEYGRQIGTDMLDKNLLDLYIFGEEQIRTNGADGRAMSWRERQLKRKAEYARRDEYNNLIYSYSELNDLMGVRGEKEAFFGTDGGDENESAAYSLMCTIEANPRTLEYYELLVRHQAPIKSLIDIAVNEMPVLVKSGCSLWKNQNDIEHSGEDFEYGSFAEGLASFFRGARAQWEREGGTPDAIIVTGGAFKMRFVRDLLSREMEPYRDEMEMIDVRRSEAGRFPIERGLAYMGYRNLENDWAQRRAMAYKR